MRTHNCAHALYSRLPLALHMNYIRKCPISLQQLFIVYGYAQKRSHKHQPRDGHTTSLIHGVGIGMRLSVLRSQALKMVLGFSIFNSASMFLCFVRAVLACCPLSVKMRTSSATSKKQTAKKHATSTSRNGPCTNQLFSKRISIAVVCL